MSSKRLVIGLLLALGLFLGTAFTADEHHEDEDHEQSADHHTDQDQDNQDHGEDGHYDKDHHHDDTYDHKAVLGSQEAADEYKELSPEESKKRLAVLVDKMDTNKDSAVDNSELFNWVLGSFKKLDMENAKNRMEEKDENSDKQVSWEEYMHKSYGYNTKEFGDLAKDTSKEMKSFVQTVNKQKEKFDLADRNKNGVLDLQEYAHFASPQNYPHMAPIVVKQHIEEFDADGDGKINLKEFIGDHSQDGSKANHTEEYLKEEKDKFNKLDKNGDGLLDRLEVLPWAMPGFEGSTRAEVTHLFKETDKNKDGKLSKDEIIGQHELWVGSHATDYGRHLQELKKEEL